MLTLIPAISLLAALVILASCLIAKRPVPKPSYLEPHDLME